jgi:hypothetical protein
MGTEIFDKTTERIKRAKQVHEFMIAHDNKLDMIEVITDSYKCAGQDTVEYMVLHCGSSCCIAGFTVAALSPQTENWDMTLGLARELLMLDRDIETQLFCPVNNSLLTHEFPREHTMLNQDKEIAAQALWVAVTLQNERDIATINQVAE